MIENCLLWREKAKKIRRETAVFGGSGGSAAVSSQFHIVLHKITAVPNFRAVTLLWADIMLVLLLVSKSGTSTPPPPLGHIKIKILPSRNRYLKAEF